MLADAQGFFKSLHFLVFGERFEEFKDKIFVELG
jgi:hypothetical protein